MHAHAAIGSAVQFTVAMVAEQFGVEVEPVTPELLEEILADGYPEHVIEFVKGKPGAYWCEERVSFFIEPKLSH